MRSFEHDGVWWDPRDPNVQWVGTLHVDQRTGAFLAVTIPTDKPDLFPSLRAYDVILGVTTSGKLVTLMGCFDRSTTGSLPGVPRPLEIFVNTVVVGFHSDERDPLISTAAVSFRHMNEWWGRSGIEADQSVHWPDMAMRYTSTAPLLVHEDGRFSVCIRSAISGSVGNHKASLLEDIHFEVHASTARRLSEFQRIIRACGDFLSLACLTFCDTTELTLVAPADAASTVRMGTHHAVPIYKNRKRRSSLASPHLLFRYNDIKDRAPAVFGTWISQAEDLHTPRALYSAGVYGGGFIETKLLALTQAAEAFHRRFYSGLYMDEVRFKTEVLEPLTAAIPGSIDDALRAALSSRLRFGNEYSLRRRMQALFREHRDALQVLVDEPESFIAPIIEHRNQFTHFPRVRFEAGSTTPREPERVLLYNWILRLLLESCFLKAMGFSPDEIRAFVAASDTYRQMSTRFRGRGAAPTPAGPTE